MGSQVGTWESQADGNQIIKWVILQSDCGTLIGRGGEGIKRINELSGSWVKVAHLEDSVRGVKERLVYIRGTPEQNIHALQIIIDKVGGWPYTTPVYDSELAHVEDKTSIYVPFLAIPSVLFQPGEFQENLFPPDTQYFQQVPGTAINIDSNFFTSSAEAQVHIIGAKESREQAKALIMARLGDWLQVNHNCNAGMLDAQSPFPSKAKPILPKQFSAQFAEQFAPAGLAAPAKGESLSVEEYMARLRSDLENSGLGAQDEYGADMSFRARSGTEGSGPAAEILDCAIKVLLATDAIADFEQPFNRYSDENIFQYIHKLTGCFLQTLPSHNVVSKTCDVRKVSIVGPSLPAILKAQELLLDFVQVYKPDAVPDIPIQVDKKKVQIHQQQMLQQQLVQQQVHLKQLPLHQQQSILKDQLALLSQQQMFKRENSLQMEQRHSMDSGRGSFHDRPGRGQPSVPNLRLQQPIDEVMMDDFLSARTDRLSEVRSPAASADEYGSRPLSSRSHSHTPRGGQLQPPAFSHSPYQSYPSSPMQPLSPSSHVYGRVDSRASPLTANGFGVGGRKPHMSVNVYEDPSGYNMSPLQQSMHQPQMQFMHQQHHNQHQHQQQQQQFGMKTISYDDLNFRASQPHGHAGAQLRNMPSVDSVTSSATSLTSGASVADLRGAPASGHEEPYSFGRGLQHPKSGLSSVTAISSPRSLSPSDVASLNISGPRDTPFFAPQQSGLGGGGLGGFDSAGEGNPYSVGYTGNKQQQQQQQQQQQSAYDRTIGDLTSLVDSGLHF